MLLQNSIFLNTFLRNKQTKSLFKFNFLAVVNDGIAPPQSILFPPEKICMDWRETQSVGVGLYNLGNTCFLNATLQCLTYTPPLANYMLSLEHGQSCEYFLRVFQICWTALKVKEQQWFWDKLICLILPVEAGFEHCISSGLRIAYGVQLMHCLFNEWIYLFMYLLKDHLLLRGNNEVHWTVMHLVVILESNTFFSLWSSHSCQPLQMWLCSSLLDFSSQNAFEYRLSGYFYSVKLCEMKCYKTVGTLASWENRM